MYGYRSVAAPAALTARMDMTDMDMTDHTGHTRTGGAFVDTNMDLARSYWYIIAALCGFMAVLRIVKMIETRARYANCSRPKFQELS